MGIITVQSYRKASGTTDPGHAGVAAWVAANSADVIGYWPMDDAAASGTMSDDSGNGNDGTYGSGMSSRTVDGEAVANFDDASADDSSVGDFAELDNTAGIFAVIELDTTTGVQQIASRDNAPSHRSWQFRVDDGGALRIITLTTGNQFASVSSMSTGTVYTVGYVLDGTTGRLYIDGTQENTASSFAAFSASAAALTVGWKDAAVTDRFNGAIGSLVLLDTVDSNTIPDLHDAWANGY